MEITEIDYYDILGVSSSASQEEIRQAFHRKARDVHPDINPNDPHAAEKYQALTEAYQALSDPAQRDNESRENLVDPTEIFEDYIRRLTIGSDAFSELADNHENLPDKLKTLMQSVQKEREKKLAGTLKHFLDQYVLGDKDCFLKQAMSEARRLSDTAYQVDILHIIGNIYSRQAAQELGKKAIFLGLPFFFDWVCNKLQYRKSQKITEKEAFRMVRIQEEILRQLMNGSGPGKDAESHAKDDILMKLLWRLNAEDIEETLVHVCQMVLHDGDVTKEQLKDRAMALKILGNIFLVKNSSREETSVGEIVVEETDDGGIGSYISSSEEELPCVTQGTAGLFGCLCDQEFDFSPNISPESQKHKT